MGNKQNICSNNSVHSCINSIVNVPPITSANTLHNSEGYIRYGQRSPKPLVTLTVLFETFPRVCVTIQWPYSKRKLHIATIMI